MRKHPVPTRLAAAFLAMALLGACGDDAKKKPDGEGAAEAPSKKIFNYVRGSAHKSLDPVKQFDQASSEIISNVYDTLLSYHYLKRPYELIPNLLTKLPELGEDGLTYSFELRDDVKFADDPCFPGGKGRKLTADDVIFSLKRFADANQNIKSYMMMQGFVEGMDEFREQTKTQGKATDYAKLDVSGLKKVDDRHFTLKLTQPNPLALFPLAATVTSIVPPEAVKMYGEELERHPVGSGPFRIKQLQRRGVIILEKNPDYHMVYPSEGETGDDKKGLLAAVGKRLPLVDEVHLPLIEEAQPRMLNFLSGKIDWIGIDRDNFNKMAVRKGDGFELKPEYAAKFGMYWEPRLSTEYFVFNMKDPLVGGDKGRPLRQAIAYALDTPAYIDKMLNGRAIALKSIVPVPIAGSERDIDVEYYSNDMAKAKAKLAEAGYPDGKGLPPITIEYRASTTTTRQSFEFRRAQLAKVGIVVKANFQTFTAFLKRVESGNFQMSNAGWMADYPDAENFYQLAYGPNETPGPNSSGYKNPEYDRLFEKARFMQNGPERFALFKQMHEILREDLPLVFTENDIAFGMYQQWVKNLKRNMMVDAPYMYLDIDVARKAKGVP